MSFKRDGNDTSLLSVLQKRRITDLFAEDIPEDEAKLLSNGRFACLVCLHHPIFDTVSMLSVHRHGKKHKSYADRQEQKKLELQQLIEKRKQEQLLKDVSLPICLASTKTGLSTSSPYDPRVRKYRVKKGGRKLQVHLCTDPNPQVSEFDAANTSDTSSSPSQWLRVAEQQLIGPVKHDYKLKNVFRNKQDEVVRIHPYTPKSNTHRPGVPNTDNSDNIMGHFSGTQTSQNTTTGGQSFSTVLPAHVASCISQNSHQSSQHSSVPPPSKIFPILKQPSSSSERKRENKKQKCHEIQDPSTNKKIAPGENELAQKYYQLQGSGWKRDWDGKWIKDEQAEFDSDEEPPDLP